MSKQEYIFPRVLGEDIGLIGDYAKSSNSDSETFNQFFNGDNNLEKGENLYFISLKALFTTRLQTDDKYLDENAKEKYTIKSLYKDDLKNNDSYEYENIDVLKKKNIDYDNDLIFIECGSPDEIKHVWVYITDNNWNRINYTRLKYEVYENISFFGPVKNIGDKWLTNCNNLKSIDFIGLNMLKTIGNSWMDYCFSLQNVDCRGLTNLKSVGNFWLKYCKYLKRIDYNGLINLETVGHDWMFGCFSLKNVTFKGLSNLKEIGDACMATCSTLENVDLSDLSNLKNVGDKWMYNCDNLETVNLSGLNSLESVGEMWMAGCKNLKLISFKELNNFKVGDLSLREWRKKYMYDKDDKYEKYLNKFCKTHNMKYLKKIKNTYIISLLISYSKYVLENNKGYIEVAKNVLKFYN